MSRIGTVDFNEQVDGDTFTTKEVNFFAADGVTPLDLSDVTPKLQVRRGSANGKLLRTATVGDGITWVAQSTGELTFGGFDTSSWGGDGEYFYDLQFTYATSGIVRTYLKGRIIIIDDVTAT